MLATRMFPLAAVLMLLPVWSASAQHADFVLFGEPNPEAAKVPAEHRFVHPITVPFFHEDSFVTSDIRAWFLYHDFPGASPIGGGSAKVSALQLRLALTDQLQFVAYKDGYINWDAGLIDDSGLLDIGAGIKWNFIQDWSSQFHMALGIGYEIEAGDDDVLQDDDEWRFWLSANKGFDRLHLGGTVNAFIANNKSQGLGNSDRMSWHLHADYYVCEWFSPVIEFNGYHVINEGFEPVPFSGIDVTNLGGGDDVVTVGIGAEVRPMENIALRTAYETPLTHGDDLFGYRWTFSLVWSF